MPYLEPGTPIFVEDLEAWEKKAGIKVTPGDALLIRTGRWARRAGSARGTSGRTRPGSTPPSAPWLKARGVALIGSDAALDVVPSLVQGINLPVHTLAITALGLNILDNQDLEAVGDLAAQAEAMGVHADRRAGAGHRRHGISGQRDRDLLGSAAAPPRRLARCAARRPRFAQVG